MAAFNSPTVIGPLFRVIANKQGSVASPLGTVSSSTGALFSANHQATIPANTITPNSFMLVQALVTRSGANATANIRAYLGTAGTNSDSVLGQLAFAATDGQKAWLFSMGGFSSSVSSFLATGALAPQGTSTTGTFGDQSANFNPAAQMTLSLGISNANAGDSFSLLSWSALLITL